MACSTLIVSESGFRQQDKPNFSRQRKAWPGRIATAVPLIHAMNAPGFYRWLESSGLIDFTFPHGKWAPWYFLPRAQFSPMVITYSLLVPYRRISVVGFMRRQDCDHGAAFELMSDQAEPRVYLLEWWGNATGPREIIEEYPDGWTFLRQCVLHGKQDSFQGGSAPDC